MGMFDDVEVVRDIENGPPAGDYQTKDLECIMDHYIIDSDRLYKKLVEYEFVPEEERKHPILGMFRSKFKGLADTNHHGYIEMYDATSTWKLKFTDGELVKCERTQFIPLTDTSSQTSNDPDEWSGDNKEQDFDPEEYEG